VVKAFTVGIGVVVTALPQGIAASYGSYLVGQAARYYFEHDWGWAGNSPKKVVRQIVMDADRDSVLHQISREIQKKLQIRDPGAEFMATAENIAVCIREMVRF